MISTNSNEYIAQTCDSLPFYLSHKLKSIITLGGEPTDWQVQEIGDGNLNLVFIVTGSERSIVVKQALPYVRAAGDSWPLSIKRCYFEYNALWQENRFTPQYVPDVYFFDETMALFAMEYLDHHIILRKELINGKIFTNLAKDIGYFLAHNLFYTSDIGMPAKDKKALVAQFSANHELCQITEDLIFTEPYFDVPRNNRTTPELDNDAKAVWLDKEMIQVVMHYKYKFMTEAQALLHGDLHSGSIMVNRQSTKVIDPEFSFMGPMAFDIGNYIGNLYMAYFSQPAHQKNKEECQHYQNWLIKQISDTWQIFESEFRQLWNDKQSGEAYPRILYQDGLFDNAFLTQTQDDFFTTLFQDTLVNAGLEINRRILGFAGVADFKTINSAKIRAEIERKSLKLARELIVNARHYQSFSQLMRFISLC